MTTITIERELLEQALSALLLPCDRWNGVQYRIVKDAAEALLNALAAPATAPTQPAFESWCASMGFIPTQARYETWQAATAATINKICADVQAAGFANGGIETPADVAPEILFQLKEKIEAATAAALAAPATAPEPICTKCGDVITAHDQGLCGCCLSTRDATSPEQKDRPINCGTGHCSCIECTMPGGPLLKDKP